MADQTIFERDGAVAVLTFNRPEARNAWCPEFNTGFQELLPVIEDDPDIRCVILTGDEAGTRDEVTTVSRSVGACAAARVEKERHAAASRHARGEEKKANGTGVIAMSPVIATPSAGSKTTRSPAVLASPRWHSSIRRSPCTIVSRSWTSTSGST